MSRLPLNRRQVLEVLHFANGYFEIQHDDWLGKRRPENGDMDDCADIFLEMQADGSFD